jgi:hypothetical protein
MTRTSGDYYGLPLELVIRYRLEAAHAEAQHEHLLQHLRRSTAGRTPWTAAAAWLARRLAGLRLASSRASIAMLCSRAPPARQGAASGRGAAPSRNWSTSSSR